MSESPFVPLSSYREYPEEEMMQRARDSMRIFGTDQNPPIHPYCSVGRISRRRNPTSNSGHPLCRITLR